ERERAAAPAALHLAHEEDPHADEQQHREPGDEDVHEERRLLFRLRLDLDPVLQKIRDEPDVARRVARDALAVGGGRLELAAFDGDLGDAAGLHLLEELRVLHRRLDGLARVELVEHGHQNQPDDEPDDQVLEHVIQRLNSLRGERACYAVFAEHKRPRATRYVSLDSPRDAPGLTTLTLRKASLSRFIRSSNASP